MGRRYSAYNLLLAISLLGMFFLPGHPALASDGLPLNHYQIEAQLDFAAAVITAQQVVTYHNRTGEELDRVVFDVTAAYYGSFTLISAMVGDAAVETKLEGNTLEVPLPQILKPDGTVMITLGFRVEIPRKGGRLGVGGGIIALGNWYPVLAVYRQGPFVQNGQIAGWDRHPYVETGDAFFSEVADYDVVLDVSAPVAVAHTGTLARREGDRWVMNAKEVRDFALVVAGGFESETVVVDGVAVEAYFRSDDGAIADTYLDAAQQAVTWLSRVIAPYPFSQLSVAEIYDNSNMAVGQEYPHLVMISSAVNWQSGSIDSYLSYLVIHEVAHQWFYALVGNDQLYSPWVDEALVSWVSLQFFRANYPSLFPGLWQTRITSLMAGLPAAERAKPVNTSIYDYDDEANYFGVVYRKGTQFFEELYQAMGEQDFFTALRNYVETYRLRIAPPMGLLDAFQAQTQVNLNPLYRRYFTYERYQSATPLRPAAQWPQETTWSGTTTVSFSAPSALSEVAVYADDRLLSSSVDAAKVTVDTGKLANGDHLLTFQLKDGEGRSAQISRRVTVDNAPGPTASPTTTSTSLPVSTSTPDAGALLGLTPSPPEGDSAGSSEPTLFGFPLPHDGPGVALLAGGGGGVVIGVTWVAIRRRRPRRFRRP